MFNFLLPKKKKKFQWEREDFIKIKSLLVLLLLELLQQSHLCWADCQVTVCDTGGEGKKKASGEGWGLWGRGCINKPTPHSCFHPSLLSVEQIGVHYIVIENTARNTYGWEEIKTDRWEGETEWDRDKPERNCNRLKEEEKKQREEAWEKCEEKGVKKSHHTSDLGHIWAISGSTPG